MKLLKTVFCFFLLASHALAETPAEKRAAVEQEVRREVELDLSVPYEPLKEIAARSCLDGREVKDFQGDVVEYWVNLECYFCGIAQAVQAQRSEHGMCIVPRHVPSQTYKESLKKALSYEALKLHSLNAANLFWDKVYPTTDSAMPLPYEASLIAAFQEAAISPEAFADSLDAAGGVVSEDIISAIRRRLHKTPTYILEGIRFPGCDFKAQEIPAVLTLAKKTRAGDEEALRRVITLITDAQIGEEKS